MLTATDSWSNSKSGSDWICSVPTDRYLYIYILISESLTEQRIPFKTGRQWKTQTLKMRRAAKVLAQDEDKDRWKALCGFQS